MTSIINRAAAILLGSAITAAVAAGPLDGLGGKLQETVESSASALQSLPQADFRNVSDAIPGRYIVVLKDNLPVESTVKGLMTTLGIQPEVLFRHALKGFAAPLSEAQARVLAAHKQVSFVEQDAWVKPFEARRNVVWGLDRIDQEDLPLNREFDSGYDGSGVHAYIVDTGVRHDHVEFKGRMGDGVNYAGGSASGNSSQAQNNGGLLGGLLGGLFGGGDEEPSEPRETDDCNGHGTHVAGTVAGSDYGVAPAATVHAIRVLDCNGSGSMSGVIKGVDWITKYHQKPAVANMSLGGGASSALDKAVAKSIDAGVHYVVAAGNEDQNACNVSPARADRALTVGATDNRDKRASFSNWGSCVDVFAPGVDIKSAWHTGTSRANTISGTSMAAPHVAGVVALWLQKDADASTSAIFKAITSGAVNGKVTDTNRSPNLLLQLPEYKAPAEEPRKEPSQEPGNKPEEQPSEPPRETPEDDAPAAKEPEAKKPNGGTSSDNTEDDPAKEKGPIEALLEWFDSLFAN